MSMSKIASILVSCVVASIFSFDAQAFPRSPGPAQMGAPDAMLVRDFCGLGFHRDLYGVCVPNGVPYGYVAPVVVAPPVVVVPRAVCPYGYYYYAPYGRCVPTP
jgi:hypothetical protein